MSLSSNQLIFIWRDVEAQLLRHEFRYHGDSLSKGNSTLVRDAYSLWYLVTHDSLISGGYTTISLNIDWIHFLCSIDVEEIALSLKDADSLLLRNECTSYDDFKHHLRDKYPFIGRLLSPMKPVVVQWFSYESIPHFSILHSWLCFISRLNLTVDVLQTRAVQDYLFTEESLQVGEFTTEESQVIQSWLPKSYSYQFAEDIDPKHGSGSTADAGRHLVDKYLAFSKDPRLSYLGHRYDPVRISSSPLSRRCRLVFVPKSLLGYRSISMEPASLMWYQQGILRSLVKFLSNHSYLRRRFSPELQEPNRHLAWLGSIDGSFATIDLSAASDSVSWNLVKTWFRDTFLYKWMLCTRSTSVRLPNGEELALKKYAPMGSALCFPIECLVFCAIVECAIRECGGNPVGSSYRVYGDDIVVETRYAEAVIRRLIANGFTVNQKKTFCSASPQFTFRESCGGEYLNGSDVTPTRLSRRFSGLKCQVRKPSRILALIDLANDCYSRYPSVRRRIIHAMMDLPSHKRPLFDSTGASGIFSIEPTNWHLPSPTWSQDYQYFTRRHGTITVDRERQWDLEVEDIRLFEYLRQVDGRNRLLYPEDRVDVDLRRQIAGKWTFTSSPAEDF